MHPDDPFVLSLAGRTLGDPLDRVRRYCGLPYSGGAPETWAYRYFDLVDSDPNGVISVDVLAAGALHAGLSRDDLDRFWDNRSTLDDWLSALPLDVALADASAGIVDHLATLGLLADGAFGLSISLTSKVLHRKRPLLIPLIDREIIDWYRPVTGERRAATAWEPLIRSLQHDLAVNADVLGKIATQLDVELGHRLSDVRIVDIAIWMGGQR